MFNVLKYNTCMACKVRISANSDDEAKYISDHLINKKLVAGCLINSGNSRFHWKGDIKQQEYYNIQAYTVSSLKQDIISEVKDLHSDDVPIIEYTDIEGNEDFIDWIETSVNDCE
jgi:periplasmic divalent cation tolerance protein